MFTMMSVSAIVLIATLDNKHLTQKYSIQNYLITIVFGFFGAMFFGLIKMFFSDSPYY